MPKFGDLLQVQEAVNAARPRARATFLPGKWVGGRVFLNEFGEEVFLPCGTHRQDAAFAGPLTFVGDGLRNLVGWDREVIITNPIREAL